MVCGGLGVSPACVASAACRRLRLLYLGGAEPSCILYQLTNDVLHRISTATVDVMLKLYEGRVFVTINELHATQISMLAGLPPTPVPPQPPVPLPPRAA